ERGFLRRYLEALEWDECLHSDSAYARKLGLPDVVAPLSAHTALAMPAYWSPGDPYSTLDDRPLLPDMPFFEAFDSGSRTFNLGFRRNHLGFAVLGDRLSCEYEILDVEPKKTRIGPGGLVKIVARYSNQ